jgi:hypothetical protein
MGVEGVMNVLRSYVCSATLQGRAFLSLRAKRGNLIAPPPRLLRDFVPRNDTPHVIASPALSAMSAGRGNLPGSPTEIASASSLASLGNSLAMTKGEARQIDHYAFK